jgi:hypothetical protein
MFSYPRRLADHVLSEPDIPCANDTARLFILTPACIWDDNPSALKRSCTNSLNLEWESGLFLANQLSTELDRGIVWRLIRSRRRHVSRR